MSPRCLLTLFQLRRDMAIVLPSPDHQSYTLIYAPYLLRRRLRDTIELHRALRRWSRGEL